MQDHAGTSIKNIFSQTEGTSVGDDTRTRSGKAMEIAEAIRSSPVSPSSTSSLSRSRGSEYMNLKSGSTMFTENRVSPSTESSTSESSVTSKTRHFEVAEKQNSEAVTTKSVSLSRHPFKTRRVASGLVIIAPIEHMARVERLWEELDREIQKENHATVAP